MMEGTLVSVIVPLYFQHSGNMTHQSVENVRRQSSACAKVKRFWVGLVGGGGGGVAYLLYYHRSLGARQSRNRNTTYGWHKELTTIIQNRAHKNYTSWRIRWEERLDFIQFLQYSSLQLVHFFVLGKERICLSEIKMMYWLRNNAFLHVQFTLSPYC